MTALHAVNRAQAMRWKRRLRNNGYWVDFRQVPMEPRTVRMMKRNGRPSPYSWYDVLTNAEKLPELKE